MFYLLMLMIHRMIHSQSYVKLMLNKRRYSSEIAVFHMFTVILHNTFKTMTSGFVSDKRLCIGCWEIMAKIHQTRFSATSE